MGGSIKFRDMNIIYLFLINFSSANFNLHNFASYFQSVSVEVGFIGIDSYVEPVITFADKKGFYFLLFETVKNAFNNLESPRNFSSWLAELKFDEMENANCEEYFDLLTCFHFGELKSAKKKILANVSDLVENIRENDTWKDVKNETRQILVEVFDFLGYYSMLSNNSPSMIISRKIEQFFRQ